LAIGKNVEQYSPIDEPKHIVARCFYIGQVWFACKPMP